MAEERAVEFLGINAGNKVNAKDALAQLMEKAAKDKAEAQKVPSFAERNHQPFKKIEMKPQDDFVETNFMWQQEAIE